MTVLKANVKMRDSSNTERTMMDTDGYIYQLGTKLTGTAAQLNAVAGVTAGTVTASKAVVVNANKDIGDFRNVDCVNLDAGASGTAGSVDVFPATASKGKLAITCTNQTGDTTVTVNANAMGQATTVNMGDPGASSAYLVMSATKMAIAKVNALTQGVAAGYKAARGMQAATATAAINTGLATITGYAISPVGNTGTKINAAPVLSATRSAGATLTVARWKMQASTNTYVAATTAGTISWVAWGT